MYTQFPPPPPTKYEGQIGPPSNKQLEKRARQKYRGANLQVNVADGAISCSLCKRCKAALCRFKVRMPEYARANGLWHGPDPEELQELSYAECKVINLARIYVSVKRVFLDRSSYASCSILEDSSFA